MVLWCLLHISAKSENIILLMKHCNDVHVWDGCWRPLSLPIILDRLSKSSEVVITMQMFRVIFLVSVDDTKLIVTLNISVCARTQCRFRALHWLITVIITTCPQTKAAEHHSLNDHWKILISQRGNEQLLPSRLNAPSSSSSSLEILSCFCKGELRSSSQGVSAFSEEFLLCDYLCVFFCVRQWTSAGQSFPSSLVHAMDLPRLKCGLHCAFG